MTERLQVENNIFAYTKNGIYLNYNSGSQDVEPYIHNNMFLHNEYGIISNPGKGC